MHDYLPLPLRKSKVFKELYQAQEKELEKIQIEVDDLNNQFSIETATWAIALYENELGIKTDRQKTLDERRSIIKSRWRGLGRAGSELIKEVIDSFTNGGTDVGFNGRITIDFNGAFGFISNPQDVFDAIEDVKPAHLAVDSRNSIRCHAEGEAYSVVGVAHANIFELDESYHEDFDLVGQYEIGVNVGNVQVITTKG